MRARRADVTHQDSTRRLGLRQEVEVAGAAEAAPVPIADSPKVAKAKIVAMAIVRRALFGPTV
jgi:hypothetical protein